MKKKLFAALALLTAMTLCACGILPPARETLTETLETETETLAETRTETLTETAQAETEEPIVQTTEEEKLFLSDVSPELMTEYFEEVVLQTEYSEGDGNPSLVQKWEMPIHYRIHGEPSEEDLEILEALFAELNAIRGFPGIGPAAEEEVENLSIYFAEPKEFNEIFSDFLQGEDAVGAARYWYYTDSNDMYEAKVGYRMDMDQSIRKSVLPEEIVNVLGVTDTVKREDSVVYQYSNFNTELTDVDWMILKLLYHPDMPCGADKETCRRVLAELYG